MNLLNNLPLLQKQETCWCWASCVLMVKRYLNPNPSVEQCSIVNLLCDKNPINRVFRRLLKYDCCNSGNDCNHYCFIEDFIYLYKKNDIDCIIQIYDANSRVLAFADIRHEIDSNRPIQICFTKPNGINAHVVVIRGYKDSPEGVQIIFNDPDCAIPSIMYYDSLTIYQNEYKAFLTHAWMHLKKIT